jgi:retrograde regulation protein 2
LPCIYRERAGISLYDALHESKPGSVPFVFSPEIIDKVSKTLARFAYICKQYKVPDNQISVFATEAMRTAKNQDEMVGAIHAASGLGVQILSPAMESMFGAMGARSAFEHVDGLFMDLGGGSVQMTYLDSKSNGYETLAAQNAKSMPYGAAKLTATLRVEEEGTTQKQLRTQMRDTFEGMKKQFAGLRAQAESKEGISIYFCGGGFRGYGSMLRHTHEIQPYPIPGIGGFSAMLKENDKDGKIFGMSKRRREQFPAIAMVVGALVEAVPKIKQVTFCSGGNRDGVLYMKLSPSLRQQDPLPLLLGSSESVTDASVSAAVQLVRSALPKDTPSIFTSGLLDYAVRNTWTHLGNSDDQNATRSLHTTISGSIASLPGLTHEVQAIIALTLCARWGNDLGRADSAILENLRLLVGKNDTFFCDYVGAILRFLVAVSPAYPTDPLSLKELIKYVKFLCSNIFS